MGSYGEGGSTSRLGHGLGFGWGSMPLFCRWGSCWPHCAAALTPQPHFRCPWAGRPDGRKVPSPDLPGPLAGPGSQPSSPGGAKQPRAPGWGAETAPSRGENSWEQINWDRQGTPPNPPPEALPALPPPSSEAPPMGQGPMPSLGGWGAPLTVTSCSLGEGQLPSRVWATLPAPPLFPSLFTAPPHLGS